MLGWSSHITAIYNKDQSRLQLLRILSFFRVSRDLLRTFYDTVLAHLSVVMDSDNREVGKLVRRASSILVCSLDCIHDVVDRIM